MNNGIPGDLSENAETIQTGVSVTDQIAAILEKEIIRGHYRRGAHLQQHEITKRFNVSRTPAREALRKLQTLGLVELVPNKGARVQLPTLAQLQQTYEIRAELEGLAARLACQNTTPEIIARLTSTQDYLANALILTKTSNKLNKQHEEQLKWLNDNFHQLIHKASGNERLEDLIISLERYFPKDVVRNAINNYNDLEKIYITDHETILNAIRRRDTEQAGEAMRNHVTTAQSYLLQYLSDLDYDE